MDVDTPEREATEQLATMVSTLGDAAIPAALLTQTKQSVIDTIGNALAGMALGEGPAEVRRYVQALGGEPQSRLWFHDRRLPAAQAALANTVFARALDFDDILDSPQVHVAVCGVPVALAIAERSTRPVSGQAFLTAIAIGAEIQCRLAAAVATSQPPGRFPIVQPTQVFGYFSAAAVAARLLGLSATATHSAFGLALMQAAGSQEMVVDATDSMGKALYAGLSCQGGIQAALMAEAGLLARGRALEGRAGLFALFYGGSYDRLRLLDALGSRFLAERRCMKIWPGTLGSHAFIEAALRLRDQINGRIEDLVAVELTVGAWGQRMCEPLALRLAPTTASAAMNNIPFAVAKALANGRLDPHDFEGDGRKDQAALAIAQRITYRHDPTLNDAGGLEPALIAVTMKDGSGASLRIDHPPGHWTRPLSDAEIVSKFRRNMATLRHVHAEAVLEQFLSRIISLETEPDMRDLMQPLAGLAVIA